MPPRKKWADHFIHLSQETVNDIELLLSDYKQKLSEEPADGLFITKRAYVLCNTIMTESAANGKFVGGLLSSLNLCNFWALFRAHKIRIKSDDVSDVCGTASGLLLRYILDQLIIETDKFFTMAPSNKIIIPPKFATGIYKLLKLVRVRAIGYNKVMGINRPHIMKTGMDVVLRILNLDYEKKVNGKLKAYCKWVFSYLQVDELFKPMISSVTGQITEDIKELPSLKSGLPRLVFRSHESHRGFASQVLPRCLLENTTGSRKRSTISSDGEESSLYMTGGKHLIRSIFETLDEAKSVRKRPGKSKDTNSPDILNRAQSAKHKEKRKRDDSETDTANSDCGDEDYNMMSDCSTSTARLSDDNNFSYSSSSSEDSSDSDDSDDSIDISPTPSSKIYPKSSKNLDEIVRTMVNRQQQQSQKSEIKRQKAQKISDKTLSTLSEHLIKKPKDGAPKTTFSSPSSCTGKETSSQRKRLCSTHDMIQSQLQNPQNERICGQSPKTCQSQKQVNEMKLIPTKLPDELCAPNSGARPKSSTSGKTTEKKQKTPTDTKVKHLPGANSVSCTFESPVKTIQGVFVPKQKTEMKKRTFHPPGTCWDKKNDPVSVTNGNTKNQEMIEDSIKTVNIQHMVSALDEINDAINKIASESKYALKNESSSKQTTHHDTDTIHNHKPRSPSQVIPETECPQNIDYSLEEAIASIEDLGVGSSADFLNSISISTDLSFFDSTQDLMGIP